ncbi:MAG: MmgE/PrpD family protein [Deltaproteobacteria bacterium]|jgi:2-methylcitrate dehydratase PrpD|nr:MmgE/PrpD family protein [Deltaproteobacteria bacterium]
MEVAEKFAKFITHTEYMDMDPSVIDYVKKLTLKQVMGMLVGSAAPTSKKVIRYVMENSGKPESGVYGCGFRADAGNAALINGFFGHASEMEDDQFPGGGISDVTTWPALLTAAEKWKLSGKEIIVALYVGQEIQNRIAMWASVGTDGIGICNLPFIGIYGATASCARALELSEEETKASLGLAMVQGLGYMHTWGTDAHFWESATVCRNGVVNAMLAKDGMTSNPVIEKCLDMLTGGDKNIEFRKMTEGLGKAPFYTNNTWIKKWGFCFFTHNFVDVLTDLMTKNGLKYEDVGEVVLHFDPLRNVVDRAEPKSAEDSRFSTQHILAYQMIHGECGLDTCTEEAVKDSRIAEARKKIKVVYHPEYPHRYFAGEGRIDLKLKNGKMLTGAMDQPYGGPKYPLTMDQVVDIYRKYLKGILSEKHIERTKDIILNLENEPDIKELSDICTFRHLIR